MTDTEKIVVKLNEEENEKSAKVTEQVEHEQNTIENGKEKEMTENENGMEKEMTENEKEKEKDRSEAKDKKDPEEKRESVVDRFINWWKGKPNAEAHLNGDETEEDDKEKPESEQTAQTEKDEKKEKNEEEQESGNVVEKENESPDTQIIDAKVQSDLDKNGKPEVKTKIGKRSSSIERRLEKIVEEQKHAGERAPLAKAEEEELESLDSRPVIDQPVSEPNTSEVVEAGKDIFEFESPPAEDAEDKSEKRKSARVEAFVVLEKPTDKQQAQTSDPEQVNIPSENDELRKAPHREGSSTQPGGKKGSQQSGKMEDVIEERHDDARRESVKDTWRRLEETDKETGSKTYRVSYTIRTTTIDKTNTDDKPGEDDDDRLFGKDVFLNSTHAPKACEGPPPEDLEDEIEEEHAREDHAANEDLDRFFESCKDDAPVATDEVGSKPAQEEIIPQSPDDIFRKLHSWDDEPTDWWTMTKKKKEYEEWMKPMKDGTIRRVIIPAVEIPYETCVHFITDWKHREEWDKTFSEIQVLKSDKQSKVIYCPVKKHDLTFETLDQEETDPPCHVMSWRKQDVINESEKADTLTRKKQKALQFITHTCGIILRPSESGDQATKITILCQLEGPVDRVLKNTFLAGHPKSWLRNLKKYYKKEQKQDNQKVVYL